MAGRRVTVPRTINRIATIGAVPVLNSYLFTLGKGKEIINGLPYFTPAKWRMQIAIAPHLAGQPVLQGQNRTINLEMLLRLRPDVVITMDESAIKALEKTGIPVIFLRWGDVSDIKANMKLLGHVLGRTSRCDDYLRYFETTMNRVHRTLSGSAKNSAPKVLFFNPNSLKVPLPITEWWIREAGGQSVTSGISENKEGGYSHEQILLWNPDVVLVSAPEQIARVYEDRRLMRVNAVLNKRVYAMPIGAHPWGQRTVEQPLTVLWAAKLFFPDRYRHVSMEREVRDFYRRFFNYELSGKDVRWILLGGAQ
jgi:iron complex transport system substrate-binding protein